MRPAFYFRGSAFVKVIKVYTCAATDAVKSLCALAARESRAI